MDDLEAQIGQINKQLRALSPEHRYMPLLMTTPGIGFVLAYTIAAEIGDITRFTSPQKLVGYTGLCPRVNQSANSVASRWRSVGGRREPQSCILRGAGSTLAPCSRTRAYASRSR